MATASVLLLLAASSCATGLLPNDTAPARSAVDVGLPWWNDRVFYGWSAADFPDSDGDGAGDLAGVVASLDHLNDGNAATLDDLGVTGLWLSDIVHSDGAGAVDFLHVEPTLGTNAEFLVLIEAAHQRGMAVIIDLPLNHTSTDHPWFTASREGEPEYVDFYVWDDAPTATPDDWEQDERGFYFRTFSAGSADLNLIDRRVGEALVDVGEFWLTEMGVDGFGLPDVSHYVESDSDGLNTAETKAWLAEYDDRLDSFVPNSMTIAEIVGSTDLTADFVGAADLVVDTERADGMVAGLASGSSTPLLASQRRLSDLIPDAQYVVRGPETRTAGAAVAATLLLTDRGVPVVTHRQVFGGAAVSGDAGALVPASTPHFGPVRDMIRVRSEHPALRLGAVDDVEASAMEVYAFLRSLADHRVLVVVNLSERPRAGPTVTMDASLIPEGTSATNVSGSAPLGALPPAADGRVVWRPVEELEGYASLIIRLD